jgi:hypothetical protein
MPERSHASRSQGRLQYRQMCRNICTRREGRMGLRFRKSNKIVSGVRLNVGLKRASLSFGGRGFTYNVGSKGSRLTVGIPGSGLSYTTSASHQNPVNLRSSNLSPKRRFSATPFVLAAFVLGLLYLWYQSEARAPVVPSAMNSTNPDRTDVTGAIPQSTEQAGFGFDGPTPLPRPRPKLRSEGVGPPLQLVPH